MKWIISFGITFLFLIGMASASWTPYDDQDMWGIYRIFNVTNVTADVVIAKNGSFSEYIFGPTIEGNIGSGVIWADSVDSGGNVNMTHIPGETTIRYPNMTVRLVKSDNTVKYCNITSAWVTPTDDQHTVYYIDSDCAVQSVSFTNYVATDLSPGGIADIFNVMRHSGVIESHKGVTIKNKEDIKVRKAVLKTAHLRTVSGLGITTETFPNFTIAEGEYQYIREVVNASEQNITRGDNLTLLYRVGGTWQHVETQNGINLTDCDDGTDTAPCSTSALYRRIFIFIVGFADDEDHTKLHQLLADEDITYTNVGDCLNTVDNPLTFTMPSVYEYAGVMVWAYCGRGNDNSWSGSFIDMRAVQVGSASTDIDTSVFLTEDGTNPLTANWINPFNITVDYILGGWNNSHLYQLEIGSDCGAGNCVYGVNDDGSLDCRVCSGGAGGEGMWVDNGTELSPNTTFAPNVNISDGWLDALVVYVFGVDILSIIDNGTFYKLSDGMSGENISSGTVADARIASTIARDSELTSANNSLMFYSDLNDTLINNSMKSYADAKDIIINNSVKSYADAKDLIINNSVKSYADAKDIIINDSLISYSDLNDTLYNASMVSYCDSQDSAQDECSEITNCVPSAWDADGDIDADEISESKINFVTACAAGDYYRLTGNDLECTTPTDTTYTNASWELKEITKDGCSSCITDAMVSDTLKASDLVTGSSVVADSEVDDDLTLAGGSMNLGTTSFSGTVGMTNITACLVAGQFFKISGGVWVCSTDATNTTEQVQDSCGLLAGKHLAYTDANDEINVTVVSDELFCLDGVTCNKYIVDNSTSGCLETHNKDTGTTVALC